MRYIVTKIDNEDKYEFTHIETKEGLDGKDVEVIKGRNVLTIEKLETTIEEFKKDKEQKEFLLTEEEINKKKQEYIEQVTCDLDTVNENISTLETMLEEIKKVISTE